ncbi:Metalloendopeptidase [Operophtera brumata]|uniref:Metalloendopeptidase n=1 Tax=Operophtera brumata TaxID=104452 RepID=A0A0L7LKG5_OPEBR|nr:Metalloendopeptidase [Operophtera brumata]
MIAIFLYACLVFANSAPIQDAQEEENLFPLFGIGAPVSGEFGEYFEGDMILDAEQKRALSAALNARNGLRGGAKRWPNRTVVYHINEDEFDVEQVKMIEGAMEDIANNSCITFCERKEEEQAGSGNGCFSSVGHSAADEDGDVRQVLNLAKGCFKHGTIVHELLHTIGFYHMQSTYDRDDYYNNDTVTDFGVEYDYESVMHYPEKAFSKNENKTIIPLKFFGADNGIEQLEQLPTSSST